MTSEETVSELDESHPGRGPCPYVHNNDYRRECDCECEVCMFRHTKRPNVDLEAFADAVESNTIIGDEHFRRRKKRNFAPRRDRPLEKDQEIPAKQPDCTEMIPWYDRIQNWTHPCPNNNSGLQKKVLKCLEVFCPGGRRYRGFYQALPGLPRAIRRPPTTDGKRYVCEDHWKDTKAFWELEDPRKIYRSHLVRFCAEHEKEKLELWRETGYNSCTCTNVDFTRWQCRACFENKVVKMQRNFYRRVEPKWFGGAGGSRVLNHPLYYKDWRKVRKVLQERHPCGEHCGKKRQSGLYQQEVLDCRCCGGYIVRPANLFGPLFPPIRRIRPVRPPPPPPTRRSARLAAMQGPRRSTRLAARS